MLCLLLPAGVGFVEVRPVKAGDMLCGSFCTSSAKDAAGTLNLVNRLFTVLVKRCKEPKTSLLHHQKLYQNSKKLWFKVLFKART